jgi:hypothetical protein
MKKAIKKLLQIRSEIKEMKSVIKYTQVSTYFKIFSTEEKRQEEISLHKAELKKLLKLEFTALENLQKQCEQAKVKNSNKSRYDTNR